MSRPSYRSFFDGVPVGLFRSTPDGRLLDANPALLGILGYSDLEVLQSLRLDDLYVNPGQRALHMQTLDRQGHLDDVESMVRRADNQSIWVRERMRAVRGESGEVLYCEGSLVDVTERVRTAEALLRSEARYRMLVETQSEGLLITDLDEVITFANPAAEATFGVEPGTLAGRSLTDFTQPDSLGFIHLHSRMRRQGRSSSYELEIVRQDGQIRILDVRVLPWRGSSGEIQGSYSSFRDITEQRRAERALAEAEDRLSRFANAVDDVIYLFDPQRGAYDMISPSFEQLTGYPMAMAMAQPEVLVRDVIHPDDLASLPNPRTSPAGSVHLEYRIVRRDGSTLWVSDIRTHEADASGQVVRVYGVVRDITAAKRAQAELAESRRMLATLLSNLQGMAYRCVNEPSWRMLFVSQAAQQLTGYSPAQIMGHEVLWGQHVVDPRDRTRIWEEVQEAVAADRPFLLQYRIRTASGEERWVWEQGICVERRPDGEVLEGYITDVTARVQAERDNRDMQAQLLQAQKLEAIGTLAGGIAHDFNNLLTAIEGFTSLARQRASDDHELCADLRNVEESVERAASLTRQLLLFGRKQALRPTAISVNRVLTDLLTILGRLIGEDIALSTELTDDLWTVVVDRGSLEQVVVNLAVNARDAMPGGGSLVLATRNAGPGELDLPLGHDPGEYVVLSVSDTGQGIAPEHVDHLFDPFFTTKEVGKGTGIGLSVVYGILRQHGGWVEVDSAPGEGATFRIILPARRGEVREQRPRHVQQSPPRPLGEGQRILVVEDESMVLRFTRRALEGSGYQVLAATSGSEAMAILQSEGTHLDLLFSDVVLPDVTGVELAEWCRTHHRDLKVLLSSGYMDQKSQWPRIQEQGLPFLQKPYSLTDLLRAVRGALEGAS